MDDRDLAHMLLQNHFTAAAALISLQLHNLPDDVRTRLVDAVRNGTGKVELRTGVDSNETELVLVPVDGRRCYGWREQEADKVAEIELGRRLLARGDLCAGGF